MSSDSRFRTTGILCRNTFGKIKNINHENTSNFSMSIYAIV